MLEAVTAVVAGTSFSSVDLRERARGLVINAHNELAARRGLTLTPDGASASTVAQAIGIAIDNLDAMAVSASCSLDSKEHARGILIRLQTELGAQGLL